MYWSQFRLERGKKITAADTTTVDLPESGLLSAIICHVRMKNATTINQSNKRRIIDHLTKIEVTDGGTKTMQSLTGQEQRANNFYRLGKIMPEQAIVYGTDSQWTSFAVLFGRKLYDPKYLIDLARWDDVDLEITNDCESTRFNVDNLSLDIDLVLAHEMPGVPAEYIKNYEWKKEIADKDADWIDTRIPTTDLIRRLMIQTEPHLEDEGNATHDPIGDNNTFQLTYKEYTEQIFNHRPKDMMRMNHGIFGTPITSQRVQPSTTYYLDTQLAYVHSIQMTNAGDTAVDASTYGGFENSNDRFQKARSISGGEQRDIRTMGMGYLHTFVIPFDLEDDPAQFLNPAKGAKGPVHIKWYAQYDDHNFRTILEVPKKQGEA